MLTTATSTTVPSEHEPLRWGVLGAASIAVRAVIPAMQASPSARVIAIASRDDAHANHIATTLGIDRAYGSYDALLADRDVEAVYIPLPNHLHVPWSRRAAEAGKHVLCEKPLALNAAEAQSLVDVRNTCGVQIAEAFMVRTHPQWHEARRILASGRIGRAHLISSHFSYFRRDPNDVRSKPEWGGGVLLDIGCYPITMSRWMFREEPVRVCATVGIDPEFGVDRLTSAMLEFPSGQAVFTVAGQLALHQAFQVYGTKGRMSFDIPFNPPPTRSARLTIDDGRDLMGTGAETITFDPVNQFTLQAEQFAAAVRGQAEVAVTLEDAVLNMRVIDALFRSARSAAWETP